MKELLKENGQFRIFMIYQMFSGLGNGIFSLFMLLSVHLIYENVIYTGIAGFLMSMPLIFSFAVGPIVDRSKKVKIMRITTLFEFGVIALLALTPLLDNLGVLFMFAVILVFSVAAMFEAPSGRAVLPHIVKEDEILQANSLINIVSLLAGIMLAVLLLSVLGEGNNLQLIFLLSMGFLGVSFLFSLILRDPNEKTDTKKRILQNYRADLFKGMKFLRKNVLLFFIVADIALAFLGQASYVNRPAFIEYYAGARGYIILTVVMMTGGLIASSMVTPLGKRLRVNQLLFVFYLFGGVTRIVFVLVLPVSFYLAIALTLVNAAVLSASDMVEKSLAQKIPPKDMVGRVDTISTSFTAISIALGALAGGFLGSVVSDVAYIFIAQGIILAAASFYFFLVPAIRKLPVFNDIVREGKQGDGGAAS